MRSSRISFLAVVTAGAGLVGFIGVFADWFSLAYEVSGTKVVLDFYGTADGTGAIAVAASLGALMFGCAYMLLTGSADTAHHRTPDGPVQHHPAGRLGDRVHAGRRGDRGAEPVLARRRGQATYTATVAIGLGISFLAGVIATVASVLLVSRREAGVEEDPPVDSALTASHVLLRG